MAKETEEKTTTIEKTEQEAKAPETKVTEAPVTKSNTQAIVIAVLATALVCIVLVFVVLAVTGVIRFSGSEPAPNGSQGSNTPTGIEEPAPQGTSTTPTDTTPTDTTPGGVTCYSDTRVQVEKLEFCLPNDFEYGTVSGGVYTYNLVDDEGWAEVKVYAEKSSQTPTQFIVNLSDNLKVTNQNYTVNGTTWVRAEAGDYMLALSTKKDNMIYTIFFSIKLDSDATDQAWNKILTTPVFVE